MCVVFSIYILCVGSIHLHGIRADRLLRKSYTKLFWQVPKIEDDEKCNSKNNSLLHLKISLHGRIRWSCILEEEDWIV
jgi:hypothetical protein